MKHVLFTAIAAATMATGASAQEISLARFFGACEDAGTDTTVTTGEACIIQSIINAADAELDGITITTLPTDWGNYYDQLKAAYAGGTPPDIHVMHRHRVPEFAGLGALREISGDLEALSKTAGRSWRPRPRSCWNTRRWSERRPGKIISPPILPSSRLASGWCWR